MNILDLDPSAFAAALDELGLVGEQRDALIAQYSDPSRGYQRDERPFLTRLGDNIIGFDDGVETQGERIGQGVRTFFDAVREDPLGVAGDMVSGLYGQVERGVQGELSPFETLELAGILSLPTAGARFDPSVARMFGGRGTTNEYANRAMDRAEALQAEGLSPEDIWRRTSEEFPDAPATVLPDGRPFYEMPDAEALTQSLAQDRAQTLTSQALQATNPEERALLMGEARRLLDEQPVAGVLSTPLIDVMSHPQLYQDFPRVGDIKAQMAASLPSNTAGQYYPPPSTSTAGVAQVSSRYRNLPETQSGILLHEVQHGVAGVTGELPGGTNPDALRSFTTELENRAGSYRTNARAESDNLMDRLDNMESYFANEGPEALRVYKQIVDPLIGRIGMATDEASAPYHNLLNRLYGTGGTNRTVTQGFSTQDPNYALYYLDPGEALARITASRREMSMAERRATTPMETLRQESRPIEWDELAEIRSPGELASYLQNNFDVDLDIPGIDGVPYYDYFRALNQTVSNSQGVVNEVVNQLSGVTDDATRRRIIAEGRDRVRNQLQNEVDRYAPQGPVRSNPSSSTPSSGSQPASSAASVSVPQEFGFTRDNPGGDWLRNKQDRAEQAMSESGRGLGRRGITGSVTGTMGMQTDMFLPTGRLSGLTGLMDENRRPGDPKFDALLARVREEGFDPNQAGNKIVIAVNHRGEPFVLEGNTRIAVARELGIPNVRAEVRYWNGAEEVEGPFAPNNVARIAAREPAQ